MVNYAEEDQSMAMGTRDGTPIAQQVSKLRKTLADLEDKVARLGEVLTPVLAPELERGPNTSPTGALTAAAAPHSSLHDDLGGACYHAQSVMDRIIEITRRIEV
jgi:hypothetical protein